MIAALITPAGCGWLVAWLASLVLTIILVEYFVRRREDARAYREGEQSGFLQGVRGERRFHQGGEEE